MIPITFITYLLWFLAVPTQVLLEVTASLKHLGIWILSTDLLAFLFAAFVIILHIKKFKEVRLSELLKLEQ